MIRKLGRKFDIDRSGQENEFDPITQDSPFFDVVTKAERLNSAGDTQVCFNSHQWKLIRHALYLAWPESRNVDS